QNAPVPCDLIGTAYFAHTTDLMARIARVLGKPADRTRFQRLHGQIASAFQKAYVTPDGRIVGHCQTSYLLALAFDLLPAGLRPKAFGHLVDLISARSDHLTTGFLGTPLLCPVLTRFGRTDLAYRILLQEDYPSWLYTVKNGATTMWERWNSYTKEHGFGDVSMNSFNTPSSAESAHWPRALKRFCSPQNLEVASRKQPLPCRLHMDWPLASGDFAVVDLALICRSPPESAPLYSYPVESHEPYGQAISVRTLFYK
ncbi:MAG: hypothetical protein EBZ05_04830, partial [Verrucomicrobia bacterium]|nr:hypothetical protein [Verrucomicrobiota bacterium]